VAERTEDVQAVANAVRGGDRRALARAITLVESTRTDHRAQATALLDELLPDTGAAVRLGISGAPGAGKSTFIEALGMHVISDGRSVAVLAVDPSSSRSGGSILGDKTRMEALSREHDAFIRPTPTGGTLGGVARRTREAMLLCEAAGFDVVLIETVGVGQSEIAVAAMVDVFLLLLAPAAGDELQGVKRGIVELADIVVVNKADGAFEAAARHTASDYANALHLMRPMGAWTPTVLMCSALTHTGIDEVWRTVIAQQETVTASGERDARRAAQARDWMWSEVTDTLIERVRHDRAVRALITPLEKEVEAGRITPAAAAARILDALGE
jgi:LAO/AO transport system kinase